MNYVRVTKTTHRYHTQNGLTKKELLDKINLVH